MNTVTTGEGERPLESNKLPAWATCLLFATSWYSWAWSVMRECGLCGDDERSVFSKASSSLGKGGMREAIRSQQREILMSKQPA